MSVSFRKSSRCATGSCVEIGYDGSALVVRARGGAIVRVDADARVAFLAAVRGGRFDLAERAGR
ncbi:hypothetical protein Acsp05_60550 [Actinokineospora sp. NBRC 105648]|nr:hypothetical protein Acsp05_60550 [Actinokineospora sp. NBRC 105648]